MQLLATAMHRLLSLSLLKPKTSLAPTPFSYPVVSVTNSPGEARERMETQRHRQAIEKDEETLVGDHGPRPTLRELDGPIRPTNLDHQTRKLDPCLQLLYLTHIGSLNLDRR